ncbi:MAG: hypothetical protein AAF616_15280 [Bacteroidota bacterium]
MDSENSLDVYLVVAHFQDPTPYKPTKLMEEDMVEKLEKMGFKPYQIRIMFEKFKPGKLMLEIENVLLSSQLNQNASPYDRLLKSLKDQYRIDFKNDEITNRMKGVYDLQKYVQHLKSNKIRWTYINVYESVSKLKIGRIYADEPIPKRML